MMTALVTLLAAAEALSAPVRPAKLEICALCHGEDGRAKTPVAPNLAGQNIAYMERALHRYRTGQREGDGMNALVRSLSPEEVTELVAWYAAQNPCGPQP
ncbi:MAG: c-type cytochrome [Xanthomonadaceae bacterium]|nr:c-type cytochrome [Xanthomonadaceae bacterium]MDP2184121.1 c-type cytochrome [Xanthomonadales bacterium]MDZ4116098.1 c-type cytochrome [Xanthomonadaceae bacterium]MDZ4377218.1 c-type cytochrome [Xanthomonadaceae bacterium]